MPRIFQTICCCLTALALFTGACAAEHGCERACEPRLNEESSGIEGESSSSSSRSWRFDAEAMFEHCLAEDYERMDPLALPQSIASLKSRGAHRCWHKHSTFLQHLLAVHNILRLWGQGTNIGRVGLFHSAYSNSYVNLALYDPSQERELVRSLIGSDAEDIVHLFCIIDRQAVVVNTLLKHGYIPKQGLTVPHLRNPSEQVHLSAEILRLLVVFTMADIADQFFSWQDQLYGGGGNQGSMVIPGQDVEARHQPTAIWPGISRPGLWMSYLSELGQVARTYQRPNSQLDDSRSSEGAPLLDIPPIFDNCTKLLTVSDEAEAIDLYWSVASGQETDPDKAIETLHACIAKNPWAFEPRVMLAQTLLHTNQFDSAMQAAQQALDLQRQWGTPWDKRLSFGAWVAWSRVLLQRAQDRDPWPTNSWGVNNLGLVRW